MNFRLSTPQPHRHPLPTTRALSLSHIIFERDDLNQAKAFLIDFGLSVALHTEEALYMRGSDAAPFCYVIRKAEQSRFVGFGLQVESVDDLQKLTALKGASSILSAPYPGGGKLVRLRDPASYCVEAITEQALLTPTVHGVPHALNGPASTNQINQTRRVEAIPPLINRLGHVALEIANFQETCAWYTQHFGFIPSDVQVLPGGSPAVTFLRLDRGDSPTDHHTLGLVQGVTSAFNHCSFEVKDIDAIAMGQRILRKRRHHHAWGMGRHILGSQIFDYWRDPWHDKHEHYCDGDQFTAEVPMGVHEVSAEAMSQWGPPMPKSFTRPKFRLSLVSELAHHLRHTPDLTLAKIKQLAKIFA